MSEMSFQQDYESGLKDYVARIGFQPGLPLPVIGGLPLPSQITDPINNVLYERSLDVPFIGEQTIGENVGLDDYARLMRAIDQGDTGQALKSAGTGAAEIGSFFLGGGLGTLGAKAGTSILPKIFGKAAPAVSAPVAAATRTMVDPILGTTKEVATSSLPKIVEEVASKARARGGWLNPKNLPKSGKIGLAVPAVGGFLALLGSIIGDAPEEATSAYVPTTVPNSVPTGPVDNTQNILDIIRQGQARQEANLRQQREDALAGFGTEERQAFADWANMLERARRGQTSAIRGDYQALYDRLAGDVGAIRGMGAAGGEAVNRRYRQAARRARREGRQENVRSGVGGLTPVSGRMADMPANLRGQGGDLAQYVRNNAAVAARDAGFNAEASLEYGNAVANEFNQNLALMRAQQEFNLETQLAREQRALGTEYDNMLADLARQGIDAETQIAIEQAQNEAAAGAISGIDLLAHPLAGPSLTQRWDVYSKILSGDIPEGTPQSTIDSARLVADQLNARYGEVSLNAYANMFADTPGGPASLGVE